MYRNDQFYFKDSLAPRIQIKKNCFQNCSGQASSVKKENYLK